MVHVYATRCRAARLETPEGMDEVLTRMRRSEAAVSALQEAADQPISNRVLALREAEAAVAMRQREIDDLQLEIQLLRTNSDAETQPLANSPSREDQERLRQLAAARDRKRGPLDGRVAELRQALPALAAQAESIRREVRTGREGLRVAPALPEVVAARVRLQEILRDAVALERAGMQSWRQTDENSVVRTSPEITAMSTKLPKDERANDLVTDVSTERGRAATIPPRIDVGIMTIIDEEFVAVLDEFPGDQLLIMRRHYNLRSADAGNGSKYRVAILRQIEQARIRACSSRGYRRRDTFWRWKWSPRECIGRLAGGAQCLRFGGSATLSG